MLVNIVNPPFLSATSFSGIATPPLAGIDLIKSIPDPIYSNEWDDANILLCLKKGTVVPTPTANGTLSVNVTVLIQLDISVALCTTKKSVPTSNESDAVVPDSGDVIEIDGAEVYPRPLETISTVVTAPLLI